MPTNTATRMGPWTPRKNLVNGFVLATEMSAARGEMSWFNAECNIADLNRMFPTRSSMLDLCLRTGVEPLAQLPRREGPGFPRANRRVVRNGQDCNVRPNQQWEEHRGEPCEHRWIVLQWAGYDCNDCGEHFGAWD